MGVKLKLNLPANVWTASDTAKIAANTLATIKLRTSKGMSYTGKKFDDYSTNPLYVSYKGARLKPKGGRVSRSGRSVFYIDGYEQYKHESRKRKRGKVAGQSANVDLVLSGQLMNNLIVLEATSTRFRIGLTKHVRYYGYSVDNDRPYIGLSDKEIDILVKSIGIDIKQKLRSK